MECIDRLRKVVTGFSGMTNSDFDLSVSYWEHKTYKKGEFSNEYKSASKYLGFILDGVFRLYRFQDGPVVEKNMFFFTANQFMCSFKGFFSQSTCEYYPESMTRSEILYIHYERLQHLYNTSPAWERFGRLFVESALHTVITNAEAIMFKSPQDRYLELVHVHPDIINSVPLYHIASFLGIEGPSLSRIRKRIAAKKFNSTMRSELLQLENKMERNFDLNLG